VNGSVAAAIVLAKFVGALCWLSQSSNQARTIAKLLVLRREHIQLRIFVHHEQVVEKSPAD
jgi:hypothetical protein